MMKMSAIPPKVLLFTIIGIVIALIASIPTVYFYRQYTLAQLKINNPTAFTQNEVKDLVARVGKLVDLPSDELPTVATVSDTSKLESQPFFAKAKIGNKVLIFPMAKVAVLYDPVLNKIVNMTTISVSATASAATKASYKFVLYNGTSVVGLTKKYTQELISLVPDATVVDTNNAKTARYEKSLIVDLIGTRDTDIVNLGRTLGLMASKLPSGEIAPTGADFLIILGTDKK